MFNWPTILKLLQVRSGELKGLCLRDWKHILPVRVCVVVIAGVLEVECETVDEVVSYLERGSTYRHTGLTRMNEHSSRSHSVFTLVIGRS